MKIVSGFTGEWRICTAIPSSLVCTQKYLFHQNTFRSEKAETGRSVVFFPVLVLPVSTVGHCCWSAWTYSRHIVTALKTLKATVEPPHSSIKSAASLFSHQFTVHIVIIKVSLSNSQSDISSHFYIYSK